MLRLGLPLKIGNGSVNREHVPIMWAYLPELRSALATELLVFTSLNRARCLATLCSMLVPNMGMAAWTYL